MSPPPPNYNNWPSIFWRPFLVVTLQNSNRYTSARAQKIFPIRNTRPMSIREPPPDRGVRGSFHRLCFRLINNCRQTCIVFSNSMIFAEVKRAMLVLNTVDRKTMSHYLPVLSHFCKTTSVTIIAKLRTKVLTLWQICWGYFTAQWWPNFFKSCKNTSNQNNTIHSCQYMQVKINSSSKNNYNKADCIKNHWNYKFSSISNLQLSYKKADYVLQTHQQLLQSLGSSNDVCCQLQKLINSVTFKLLRWQPLSCLHLNHLPLGFLVGVLQWQQWQCKNSRPHVTRLQPHQTTDVSDSHLQRTCKHRHCI